MTDYNDKIRAVVLAALMVLSVFAGTIAFAGTAAAVATDVSAASASNVQATDPTASQDVSFDVTLENGTSDTISINFAAGNVQSITSNSSSNGDVAIESTSVVSATQVDVTVNDTNPGNNNAETSTIDLTLEHDLTNQGPASGVSVTVNDTADDDSAATTFDVTSSSRPGGVITDTAYLGEEGVDLTNVAGITASGAATLYGVAGEADGSTAQVGDVSDADLTSSNNFQQGGYSTDSGSETVELSVVEPRVTGMDIYRGTDDSGADVTDGSILTSDDAITVEADFNFEAAEGLEITIEDEDGIEVQTQLSASDQGVGAVDTIDSSGDDDVTFTGVTNLDTGEYTVTVEGEDDLDGASRSATFTIRDEDQTISLSESTVTQGDSVVATVTGTPGNYGVVKIDAGDTEFDGADEPTNADAQTIFDDTGDVEDIFGTEEAGYPDTDDEWVAAQVFLDDEGEAIVRIQTENVSDGSLDVEFNELGGSRENVDSNVMLEALDASANDSAELTVDEQEINITSAPSTVRIGEEFTIEGTAAESDDVKAYAKIDQNYVPLVDEDGDLAEDDVDSNGEFTLDIDSGSEISLPDSYRIAVVADPVDDDSTNYLGSTADIGTETYSEFDTKATTTVRTVEGDLTAQLSTSRIASNVGDEVTLSGTALGQGDDVRVYLIGPRGNFLDASGGELDTSVATEVDIEDEEFDEDFDAFSNRGTYTFLVVGQGRDGSYDSEEDLGRTADELDDLTPQQAIAVVNDEYTGAGSDDQIVELTLQAENPQLTIDDFTTDGQVAQGEVTVSGTSNREDGTTVFIEVLGQNENVVASTEAEVNGSQSTWSVTLDMSDVETGTYTLRADDDEASSELEFELVESVSTPTEEPTETEETPTEEPDTETATEMPDTDEPTDEPTEATETTSTSTPGFGVIVALIALIAAALLAVRRDN